MRFPIRGLVALCSTLAALLLGLSVPRTALAADGYVNGYVNLRAGPSTRYPRVFTLPPGTPIAVFGCTAGWGWCDVRGDGMRGWIAANFVRYPYRNRRVVLSSYGARIGVPIISFVLDAYWGDHYRDRSWYAERARWAHPDWSPPARRYPGWAHRPGPPASRWGNGHDRGHGHDRPHGPPGGGGGGGGGGDGGGG